MESNDAATAEAVIKRLREFRLPRAIKMQETVEAGGRLSESDMAFLKRVFSDTRNIMPIVDRNPEYQKLCATMIELYNRIISKAMENEQAG